MPEEVRLSKEIEQTKEALARLETEDDKARLHKQLCDLTAKFNMAMEYNRKFKKSLY